MGERGDLCWELCLEQGVPCVVCPPAPESHSEDGAELGVMGQSRV